MGVKKPTAMHDQSSSDDDTRNLETSEGLADCEVDGTVLADAVESTTSNTKLSKSQRKRLKKVRLRQLKREQKAKQPRKEEQEPPLSSTIVLPKRSGFVSQLDTEEKRFSAAMARLAETYQHVLKIQPIPHLCPPGLLKDLCPLAISIRMPTTSRSGYAFLQFRNQHELEVAQKQLLTKTLNGKPLKVEPAMTTRNERQPSDFEWTTLFVTHLPRTTTRMDLGQLFRKAHRIRLANYDDGSCKGSCFLFYKSPQDALRAFESRHGAFIHGAPIYVNFALKKQSKPSPSFTTTLNGLIGMTDRVSAKRPASPHNVSMDDVSSEPLAKQLRTTASTDEVEFLIDRTPDEQLISPRMKLSKKLKSEATNRRIDQSHPKLLNKHQLKGKGGEKSADTSVLHMLLHPQASKSQRFKKTKRLTKRGKQSKHR